MAICHSFGKKWGKLVRENLFLTEDKHRLWMPSMVSQGVPLSRSVHLVPKKKKKPLILPERTETVDRSKQQEEKNVLMTSKHGSPAFRNPRAPWGLLPAWSPEPRARSSAQLAAAACSGVASHVLRPSFLRCSVSTQASGQRAVNGLFVVWVTEALVTAPRTLGQGDAYQVVGEKNVGLPPCGTGSFHSGQLQIKWINLSF